MGMGGTCIGLSLEYLKENYRMVPPEIGFIIYVMCSSVSLHSLPLMMLFEIIPLQVSLI